MHVHSLATPPPSPPRFSRALFLIHNREMSIIPLHGDEFKMKLVSSNNAVYLQKELSCYISLTFSKYVYSLIKLSKSTAVLIEFPLAAILLLRLQL